ncbi:MAG: polysaccharide biosynthesis/export family protein [Chitinophagales bacterium]|nr:polysaccharide biosynthesis/export family protein [Chitinophagales bacterium]
MKTRNIPVLAVLAAIITLLPSCRVLYPNLMFRQKDYQYFDLAQKELGEYLIQPGDQFTLRVFARDGFKLIDVIETEGQGGLINQNRQGFLYTVDNEGFVRLPVLGEFFVTGFTERTLERTLEEKYAGLFVDPWVNLRVSNRRAFVFTDGSASIVQLNEYPITIIELLARSGGLDTRAKAYKIKVIRGDIKNPQVYLVDLSTIEGIRKADLSVQPNDIVVIERRRAYVTDVLREITPYTGAITTIATLVILFRSRFGQ